MRKAEEKQKRVFERRKKAEERELRRADEGKLKEKQRLSFDISRWLMVDKETYPK